MLTTRALLLCHLFWLAAVAEFMKLDEVHHLTGEPDFRDVTLRWEYERSAPLLYGFQVHYCELQAWGPHRCRTKMIEDSLGHEVVSSSARFRMYSVIISGLRMSTNYSFDVRPVQAGGHGQVAENQLLSRSIVVPTKGFSARATQCLPHASEVEVLTGPHFGGRIAVEAADGERCAVDGDPDSKRDTYILRIDHEACGTHVNDTTVATFVIVQENLPILTHSTRRFLVLCSFQPETLTVRAGINLPGMHSHEDPPSDNRVDHIHPEVMPYDTEMESVNDVQVSHLQHHRQLVDARSGDALQDQSAAQLVLMVILVVAGVIGTALAAWWFLPGLRKQYSDQTASSDTSSTISMYENFENSMRDSSSNEYEASVLDLGNADGGYESNPTCGNNRMVDHEECPRVDTEDNIPGVFTIRMPSTCRLERERACITIEHNSHSEA